MYLSEILSPFTFQYSLMLFFSRNILSILVDFYYFTFIPYNPHFHCLISKFIKSFNLLFSLTLLVLFKIVKISLLNDYLSIMI